MRRKIIKYIANHFFQLMMVLAILTLLLSAFSFFSPTLTPVKDLATGEGKTVAEKLADLAYFLFLAGAMVNFWKVIRNGKN